MKNRCGETPLENETLPPEHVAIIMDGNRRWAKERGFSTAVGYWQGAQALFRVLESASALGIKVLTVYAFSTENWKRPAVEVHMIMRLLYIHLNSRKSMMIQNGVKLRAIGDLTPLPQKLLSCLEEIQQATSGGEKIELILAINYGARDEIRRAVIKMITDHESGSLQKDQICESLISHYLDTAGLKDPDLVIRTSGESRLSNFLLWQSSYSELYITTTLWPDFDQGHLKEAITAFQKRSRRIGC
ncbi:MAG: polyprenyl diphosphate synthase [Candidatus Rhabdochlamydia sp.]